jgi:hypothetical protein
VNKIFVTQFLGGIGKLWTRVCDKGLQHICDFQLIFCVGFKKMSEHIAQSCCDLMCIDQYHLEMFFIGKAKISVFRDDEVIENIYINTFCR